MNKLGARPVAGAATLLNPQHKQKREREERAGASGEVEKRQKTEPEARKTEFPCDVGDPIGRFINPTTLLCKPALRGARHTMAQNGFTLNMQTIDNEAIPRLAKLLIETQNVTKLRIKDLNCAVFNAALQSVLQQNPSFKFGTLASIDLQDNDVANFDFSRFSVNNIGSFASRNWFG